MSTVVRVRSVSTQLPESVLRRFLEHIGPVQQLSWRIGCAALFFPLFMVSAGVTLRDWLTVAMHWRPHAHMIQPRCIKPRVPRAL